MSFSSDLAMADAAVAGYFDEALFGMSPMADGIGGPNAARRSDPDRAPFDFVGTIEFGPPAMGSSTQNPKGQAALPPGGSGVSHQAVITALASAWLYLPKKEDRIMHGAQAYVVATVQQDGTDRIAIYVNKVRSA